MINGHARVVPPSDTAVEGYEATGAAVRFAKDSDGSLTAPKN
ncbi:hypothetical protein SGL43_07370 [Streptomyces globisporus]|uniref:Uncharacterized protein n=1 Tax=Streptomyces globisporus TaxID=1908 RepID=A0ABM9H9F0_STRGL|nr:hypothetical protein SGL43_07370 [Streptomyces globisporus]